MPHRTSLRLVFAGTPEPAVPSLLALIDSGHEVVAVVTRPDAPAGRGRRLAPSPVAEVAAAHGIEVLKPESAKDPGFLTRLRELAPDACPVVAYGALIPQVVLDVPRHGWVNLHFSLLPAWRGAAPVQHAIWHGDEITGASTFRLEAGLDTGPVFGVVTASIAPDATSGALLAELSESGAHLLVKTIDGLAAGELAPVPQPSDGISWAPKITVEDARVDWTRPGMAVDRMIRACTPAPGAWTTFDGARVKVGPARPERPSAQPELGGEEQLAPGELRVSKREVAVGTGTGALTLSTVQPQGKRDMSAADWARGLRLESGATFA